MIKMRWKRMVTAAVCLALCLVLPFLTGQIPQVGRMLAPMHLPVLLAGFLCGPWWALAVGVIAPPLRFALFSAPPFPGFAAMALELGTYGLISGLLYRKLEGPGLKPILTSMIPAMLAGRVIWGIAMAALMGLQGGSFPFSAFVAGAFVDALPGIVIQLILVPAVVLALRKTGLFRD